MNMQKSSTPPRLVNYGNMCAANCIFQVLLNDQECFAMIAQLNDDDPLKKIAIRFTASTNGNRSINLCDLYKNFPPIIEARNDEKAMHINENYNEIQLDPLHIFEKILNNYYFINKYFQTSNELVNFTQVITISDDSNDVQNGLNARMDENLGEYIYAPKCLCISVARIISTTKTVLNQEKRFISISKKRIKPNKYIHYSPIDSEIDEYYMLYSIILHHNSEIDRGHFEVLLFLEDKFFQCNDTHLTDYLKSDISDSTLEKKNYIFFYKKLDSIPDDYNNELIVSPPRKITNNSSSIDEKSMSQSSYHNSISNQNDLFHVTELNGKTIPLFIPYNCNQSNGEIIPSEPTINDSLLQSYRLVDKIDNNCIKFDIHKKYKFLNGFLDIAPGESLETEYSSSEPAYIYTQNLLEVFTEILCSLTYYSDGQSNGEINAILTSQKLKIEFNSAVEMQIREVGELLFNLFKDYENKKPKINRNKIEKDIISIIKDLIIYDVDEDENIIPLYKKNNSNPKKDFPDEDYDWQSRINEYGIKKILEKIESNNNIKNAKMSNSDTDKVRQKLWNDFILEKSNIKSKLKFVQGWVKSREAAVKEGAKYISERRAYSILTEFIKNGHVVETKKQAGAPPKFSNEAKLCLLATIMDFPCLTDEQRTNYLNEFGPCKKDNVSVRLVNKELGKLNITIKKPCFSDAQRNSMGFLIARYIWSKIMLQITEQRNALFVFIDEAGVQKSQASSSRGFVSITPLVDGSTKSNNIASILTAVIPGYGSISRWYKGGVTNNEYGIFIREIAFIIRTHICNKSTQIILIQDNASIHKTKEVRDITLKYRGVKKSFRLPFSKAFSLIFNFYI